MYEKMAKSEIPEDWQPGPWRESPSDARMQCRLWEGPEGSGIEYDTGEMWGFKPEVGRPKEEPTQEPGPEKPVFEERWIDVAREPVKVNVAAVKEAEALVERIQEATRAEERRDEALCVSALPVEEQAAEEKRRTIERTMRRLENHMEIGKIARERLWEKVAADRALRPGAVWVPPRTVAVDFAKGETPWTAKLDQSAYPEHDAWCHHYRSAAGETVLAWQWIGEISTLPAWLQKFRWEQPPPKDPWVGPWEPQPPNTLQLKVVGYANGPGIEDVVHAYFRARNGQPAPDLLQHGEWLIRTETATLVRVSDDVFVRRWTPCG